MPIADDFDAINEARRKLAGDGVPSSGISDYDVEVSPGSAPMSWTDCMRIAGIFDCSRALCYWNSSRKCIREKRCVGAP